MCHFPSFLFSCGAIEDFSFLRIFCSVLGSDKNDVLILEEPDENVYVNIRNTKDFRYVTVNIFSDISSKVSFNFRCILFSFIVIHICPTEALYCAGILNKII